MKKTWFHYCSVPNPKIQVQVQRSQKGRESKSPESTIQNPNPTGQRSTTERQTGLQEGQRQRSDDPEPEKQNQTSSLEDWVQAKGRSTEGGPSQAESARQVQAVESLQREIRQYSKGRA